MPRIFKLTILSILFCRIVNTSEINVLNLCTWRHCEDCSSSKLGECKNGAISNLCGDLCGCCHSCVKLRDFGESCGAQLSVRSSEKFEDTRSRVTVLATTSCKKGLICLNFVCMETRGGHSRANDEDVLDPSGNLITRGNSHEYYHQNRTKDTKIIDDGVTNDYFPRQSESNEKSSTIGSNENEIFRYDLEPDLANIKNISFDPSGHLINLLVTGREFQLIYGYDPLRDLDLLIKSIDENQSNSLINEAEVQIIIQRLTYIFKDIKSRRNELKVNEEVEKIRRSLKKDNQLETKNPRFKDTLRDTRVITVLRNFVLRPRSPKISRSRVPVRKFRKKRELEQPKAAKDNVKDESDGSRAIDDKSRKEYSNVSVYDIVNKTPKPIEDFDRWFISRKVETNPEEKVGANDATEPAINIHISGMPRMTNQGQEKFSMEEKGTKVGKINEPHEKYENYDDFEMIVGDANTDVPKFLTHDEKHNLTSIPGLEGTSDEKNIDIERSDNGTEENWENSDANMQNLRDNYEFTFPENPVTLESDYYREIDIFMNETIDEFKLQLDRIETKAILIENVLFDVMKKIEMNERWKSIENGELDAPSFGIIESEDRNRYIDDYQIPRARKPVRTSMEDSGPLRYSRNSPESRNFPKEDTRIRRVTPNRSNRHWRTIKIEPDSGEDRNIVNSRKRRPNRSEGKIIEPEVPPRRVITRNRDDSDRRKEDPSGRRSSSIKSLRDLPGVLGPRKLPIFLSKVDSNVNFNGKNEDPRLFSQDDQSNLPIGRSLSHQRSVWPLNLVLNRALSADRTKRKNDEGGRNLGGNYELQQPVESLILLETQIPKSIVASRDSTIFDDRIDDSSLGVASKYDEDDAWQWDDEKSLNLFVVDDDNTEFDVTSSRYESPETRKEAQEIDEGDSIFPAYLDYSERSETKNDKNVAKIDPEMNGSTENPESRGRISATKRRKRDVVNNFPQAGKVLINDTRVSESGIRIQPNSTSDKNNVNEKLTTAISSGKDSNQRSRRSVKMVDWLRAAQEYHEGLRQVRNAAARTWLASKDEFDDTNLTNVKLFTREIPPYLERYTPKSDQDDYGSPSGENDEYGASIHDPEDSTAEISEILTEVLSEQTPTDEKDSGARASEKIEEYSELGSSSVPKKFTIITDGNSSIKIEEIFPDDDLSWFEDQSAQGSTESGSTKDLPITISESDYFDHMYESLEADDEDFDYEDPNLTMSGWLDQVDVIESSSVEVPKEQLPKSFELKDEDDEKKDQVHETPSSRFKRDSPLFLFKINGKAGKDVVVWPSNWRDLIERHLRTNRSRDEPRTIARRKSYPTIAKIDPKLSSSSIPRKNVDDSVNWIPTPSEVPIVDDNVAEESRIDLDGPRRLQKVVDHRSRQSKRKNGSYRKY